MYTLYRLAVGDHYNQRRTRWPEAAALRFTADGHQLMLFIGKIRAVRTDPAHLG